MHRKGKRWEGGPRSKRRRERDAWVRLRLPEEGGLTWSAFILKLLYPQTSMFEEFVERRPKWADWARKHGWMTFAEWAKAPLELAPNPLFMPNPFFKLFPKDTVF